MSLKSSSFGGASVGASVSIGASCAGAESLAGGSGFFSGLEGVFGSGGGAEEDMAMWHRQERSQDA